ncbi:MAG: 16S rRNA (adenine(1518)-N(6)/adenine(1519)-N(6))-dimethyltransferase RsmA, partial [bacterium]|nr:16S rRNA (adenine(1518)-N(6)/adenine(1519)-N(6))-dimethyltransferase RsmA [bacterium]
MDLTNLQTIKSLLAKYNAWPNKFLGQYFLRDPVVLEEIIGAAEISQNDKILEIGPGLGVLTLELARRAQKVVAVEKDKKLAEILENILKQEKIKNVQIIIGDILKIPDTRYKIQNTPKESLCGDTTGQAKYKVVANLPYYLTARLIRKLLELPNPPTEMILMLQKEVAERICSRPPKMNLLAVSVQFYGEPQIIAFVSRKSFWPEPEVDSAIIKIIPHNNRGADAICNSDGRIRISRGRKPSERYSDAFFKIVRAGFISPRKKLVNNLTGV